jgi:hypothetical protein
MTTTDAKETEMLVRQISWMRVYCVELNTLEQPGMPMEKHQEIMRLRGEAAHFFWLVSSLLKDALILGLDNLLDTPKADSKTQLTIEHVVKSLNDPIIQSDCKRMLAKIRGSDCYREVKIARNHLIAHANRDTLLRRDGMSTKVNFPNLTISRLEDLLQQVIELAGRAFGKLPSEFFFHEWDGVSQLFDRLRIRQ